eukprot:TRINITY_DN10366_c0_g1_i1.p1 TRINITY_DN10366_c0_g1~~TRINITY_DN10366_c0_g1_i1.p1  ORF type:complete len:324 (-),score=66.49 TRINITY_DN10366_c0_g1_i1:22-993(-)
MTSIKSHKPLESYETLTTEWDGLHDFDLIEGVNVSTSSPAEPSNFSFGTHIQLPASPILKIHPSISAQYSSQTIKHTQIPRQESGTYKDINKPISKGYRFSTSFELENKVLQLSYLHQLSPLWKLKGYSITPLEKPETSDVIGAIQYKKDDVVFQVKATNERGTVGLDCLKKYSKSLSFGGEITRSYTTQQNDISVAVRASKDFQKNWTVANTLLTTLSANSKSKRILLDSTLSFIKNNEFIFSTRIKHEFSESEKKRKTGLSFGAKWALSPRFNLPLVLNAKWNHKSVGLIVDWRTKYGTISGGVGVIEGIKTYGKSLEMEL